MMYDKILVTAAVITVDVAQWKTIDATLGALLSFFMPNPNGSSRVVYQKPFLSFRADFKASPTHTSLVGLFLNIGTIVLAPDGLLVCWAATGVFSRHGASTGRSRKWNYFRNSVQLGLLCGVLLIPSSHLRIPPFLDVFCY
ncbi:hypothetical protein C8Q79DRAFT_924542 [Trametes meyenii]|nr:hypothetical protein C8Q79DRAFT_924542 [Trametes meyenii]